MSDRGGFADEAARVRALLQVGRHERARDLAAEALASHPEDPYLLELLAVALLGLKSYDDALRVTARLCAVAPHDPAGRALRAKALFGLERHAEAIDAARASVALSPQDWAVHADFALMSATDRRLRKESISSASRAVELAPTEPEAHYTLGMVLLASSRYLQARTSCLTALSLAPGHSGARTLLTYLDGDTELREAAEGYLAVLRSDPHDEQAQAQVGRLAEIFICRIAGILSAGCGVALVALANASESVEQARPTQATWIIGTATLVLAGLYAGLVYRTFLRPMKAVVREKLRKDEGDVLGVLIFPTSALALLCFVPGGAEFGAPVAVVSIIGALLTGMALLLGWRKPA